MLELNLETVQWIDIPVSIIGKLSPRASQIFTTLLGQCSEKDPHVVIDQGWLGSELGIHRDTVGRWVRYLEEKEYLKLSGYTGYGGRKRYEINFAKLAKMQQEYANSHIDRFKELEEMNMFNQYKNS